jgi:hypothetical protein
MDVSPPTGRNRRAAGHSTFELLAAVHGDRGARYRSTKDAADFAGGQMRVALGRGADHGTALRPLLVGGVAS